MPSISVPVAAVAAGADASAAAGVAAATAAATTGAVEGAVGSAALAATDAATTASIAGMTTAGAGSIFTLGNAATAASILGTTGSAFASHEAGVANKNEAEMKSRQAGLEAGQKQIQIRQNMLKALASQNAAAGAGGIGTGGSFGANVNRQITQNQSDLLALSADTSSQQSLYGQQASNAVTTGNLKAGASLMDYVGSKTGPVLG